ncbi:MAG: hypothetical protein HY554_10310 [Elusimicrobia bacterium]|nr:hypothetical protein [Elusimicrobiota bacterium]
MSLRRLALAAILTLGPRALPLQAGPIAEVAPLTLGVGNAGVSAVQAAGGVPPALPAPAVAGELNLGVSLAPTAPGASREPAAPPAFVAPALAAGAPDAAGLAAGAPSARAQLQRFAAIGEGRSGPGKAEPASGEASAAQGHGLFDLAAGGGAGGGGRAGGSQDGEGGPDWSAQPFARGLVRRGVPAETVEQLARFLVLRHPGDQARIYHGLAHTFRLANIQAAVLEGPGDMDSRRAVLLILAALLHDLDPDRTPNTQAKVARTMEYLESDVAQALLAGIAERSPFDPRQLRALIRFTDFDPDPARLQKLQELAEAEAEGAFEAAAGWAREWGARLAFLDKIAMYTGSVALAERAVRGLGLELRTESGKAEPTDELLLANTWRFLEPQLKSPYVALLPRALRSNLAAVFAHFRTRPGAAPAAPQAAAEPARAPPAKEVAARHAAAFARDVRGIMGSRQPTQREREAMFDGYLEARSLAPEVERELDAMVFPDDGLDPISERFRPYARVLRRVSREQGLRIASLEAIIKEHQLDAVLSGARDGELLEHALEQTLAFRKVREAAKRFPRNWQGDSMRALAEQVASRSGKSIEEVRRPGAFMYVDFGGLSVQRVFSGRDPDNRERDVVFYWEFADGIWEVSITNRNKDAGASKDSAYLRAIKGWLVAGGVAETSIKLK